MGSGTALKKPKASAGSAKKRSGLRKLKPGENLFNVNDPADSLFIIQQGQIRLFLPKGKGFVEIAVLRTGEVIGEMAYFDIESHGRRSCSATCISHTDVIEISFQAFEKTMQGLNPWFKTIIETLAKRLRKTNAQVKELESNQVSHSYGPGDKSSEYKFFRNVDIIRILSVIFLAVKSHGTQKTGHLEMHKNLLKFYAIDIFNIQEAKYEEFLNLMRDNSLLWIEKDKDNLPNIICCPDIEIIRSLVVFFNNQRNAQDDKKQQIGERCEYVMDAILAKINEDQLKPNDKGTVQLDVTPVLEQFKYRNLNYGIEDLEDAQKLGLTGEPVLGEGNSVFVSVNLPQTNRIYHAMKLSNMFTKFNKDRSGNY